MKGIKMSDCRFYVNEDERTVVCVIPYTEDMLKEFLIDNTKFSDIDFYMGLEWKFIENNVIMPKSFIGKAVCSPDDEWNEEVGKMIAFARAKDKCYKSFFRRANHFIQTIDRRLNSMIECFNNFGMQLEDKHLSLEHKINTLVDKKESGDA